MIRRYLVLWYDGNDNRASIVDDDDNNMRLPFGFDEREVIDESCEAVHGIVLCADAPNMPFVTVDESEIEFPPEAAQPATAAVTYHGKPAD